MLPKNFNSIIDIVKAFPTEQSCIEHLESLRWNGNVVSPFDATSKVYKCKGNKYRLRIRVSISMSGQPLYSIIRKLS